MFLSRYANEINFVNKIVRELTSSESTCCVCGTRSRRDLRRHAGVHHRCNENRAYIISARMHAHPPVTRSLFAREYLFIHQRGSPVFLSCICIACDGQSFSCASVQQSQFARINSSREGVSTRAGESRIARVSRKNSVGSPRAKSVGTLYRSRGSANISGPTV